MNKMPRIWREYLSFLIDAGLVLRAKDAFNEALRVFYFNKMTIFHHYFSLFMIGLTFDSASLDMGFVFNMG